MINALLKDIHRLRKLVRDANAEVEKAPKVHKAHQTKVANLQKAVADAKDELKKRKAHQMELESRLKAAGQTLEKHIKQLDGFTDPKVIAAKDADIKSTKAVIAGLEDEIFAAITDIEDRTAKLPLAEAAAAKGVADFAAYEVEAKDRVARLKEEAAAATKQLAEQDAKLPAHAKVQYDRLVKTYGADGLAAVEGGNCTHCRIGLTQQQLGDLSNENFACCKNCGRAQYLVRATI